MPSPIKSDVTNVDGSLDFSGGVDSYLVTTIQSAKNPNGLARNQLSWMSNATVRAGGITQRPGWMALGAMPKGSSGLYQGAYCYANGDADPYMIVSIGGNIWKCDFNTPSAGINLSAIFGLYNPPTLERCYFVQAEEFLVIQAGDAYNLPLFWDGSTLRRSLGLGGDGYLIPNANIGALSFIDKAAAATTWIVPAIGAAIASPLETLNTPPLVGTIIYLLQAATYDPVTGQITSFSSIAASFEVTARVVGVPNKVTFKTKGYSPTFAPTTVVPGGQYFFTLTTPPSTFAPGTSELPPATAMDYYMGRIWYAQGRQYSAGDIVGNEASGTKQYNFRDSVLKVTENPLAVGGDGFLVPADSGNIRAIKHSANINTQLGEGQLYVFTRRDIFSLTVPITRIDWINATGNNQPVQTVVQVTNGAVNDRSVVAQNGDLFFQCFEPSIRSLVTAVRNFNQWSNTPISINEQRAISLNDRALMHMSSGISFDNRMLQTVLPYQTPVGVASLGILPLNFDVISTFERELQPVWEGVWSGVNVLELLETDYGGMQRAFATSWSDRNQCIELWEISAAERFESGGNRVEWFIEFPAFTWNDEFDMKKMVSAEMWIDKIYGEVAFKMEYRPDGDPCYRAWHTWKLCTAKDSCDDNAIKDCLYPTTYRESFRQTVVLPNPPFVCDKVSKRPSNVAFQIQPRLSIKGFCRIRGILLKAEPVDQALYSDMVC